jgi:hypothetical protein
MPDSRRGPMIARKPRGKQGVGHLRGWRALPGGNARHRSFGHRQVRRDASTMSSRQGEKGLAGASQCSTFVLVEIETLGIARSLGWRVHMRCLDGHRESTKSVRRCVYRKQLDLDTLVCTRGPNFPLSRLESRLMRPACGNRSVTVVFEPPTNREVRSG